MSLSPRSTCLAWLLVLALGAAPGPAGAAEQGKGPLKVFILAGQSNMEGHGKLVDDTGRNEGKGSMRYLVEHDGKANRFGHLVDEDGNWRVLDDVWIWYLDRKGCLTVGYGAKEAFIGPELQFGHVVGRQVDDQVLLIKTAWGGKSIAVDFRPPSSGPITFELGKNLQEKIRTDPEIVGRYYRQMVDHVREVLANLDDHFPDYDGRGYQIAGLGWHQGWNDGGSETHVAEYEQNLVNLIRDLRKDLGVEGLPVVIANSGFGGWENDNPRRVGIMNAQLAVAKRPEFKGSVTTVETRDFFRPPEVSPSQAGYHWNHNAETHFLIGDAMGRQMLRLLFRDDNSKEE